MPRGKRTHRGGEISGRMSRLFAADVIAHPHMYDSATVKSAKAYIAKHGTEDKPKVARHRK